MPRIQCRIVCHSNSSHLAQVYAGFALLQRRGVVRLVQECRTWDYVDATQPPHLRDARFAHLLVVVNDGFRLYYDAHDCPHIDVEMAGQADFYFKRSYASRHVPENLRDKVFPLGLNYPVCADGFDRFELHRSLFFAARRSNWRQMPKHLARNLLRCASQALSLPLVFVPTMDAMNDRPRPDQEPRIVFLTAAWAPDESLEPHSEKMLERRRLNERRAECIRRLRQRFGDRFVGGFSPTRHAVREFPDVLMSDPRLSIRRNYLNLLRSCSIGIATAGLHGSIGWKMGEYVAFAKAIVSERLNHEVPGDFRCGRNYLEFSDSEQCADAVGKLMCDHQLRHQMMQDNRCYYESFLRPDAMVLRTLKIALARREGAGTGGSTA